MPLVEVDSVVVAKVSLDPLPFARQEIAAATAHSV
jgi:hypothetical protein